MHFAATVIATVAAFVLGTNAVVVQVRGPNIAVKREETAEGGEKCFDWGETRCNGAFDNVMKCLGPPGGNLQFGGILPCVGKQVCVGGGCQILDNDEDPEPTASEVTPEPTLEPTPEPTFQASLGQPLQTPEPSLVQTPEATETTSFPPTGTFPTS